MKKWFAIFLAAAMVFGLAACTSSRSSGNKVTLLGVNEVIRDVLELTGLVKLFELE